MTATRFTIQMSNSSKSYRNGFRDSAVSGTIMFQWGQANSVNDSAESFPFQTSFASTCYAVITTASNPNTRSALPVVSRQAGQFTVNRDSAIDGPYPFYYIAIGDAPNHVNSALRSSNLDEQTAVFWGTGTSSLDGDE